MAVLVVVPFALPEYINDCLSSIHRQSFQDFDLSLMDDRVWQDGSLQITHRAIDAARLDPQDVIVVVDGDDVITPDCLEHIHGIYQDPTVWLTYSGVRIMGGDDLMFQWTRQELSAPRRAPWKCVHLKTFRYGLYRRYLELDPDRSHHRHNREIVRDPADVAMFLPLLEMAGPDHIHAVQRVIYLYRRHDQNVDLVGREKMMKVGASFPAREPFPKIPSI